MPHVVLYLAGKCAGFLRLRQLLCCFFISDVAIFDQVAGPHRGHLYSCSLAERPCIKLFRINTCKSLSKQTALTPFRMNTYEKHGGWGFLLLTRHSSKGVWSRLPSNVHTIVQSAGFGRRAIRDRSIARRSGIPCAPPSPEFLRLGIYANFPSRWSRLRPT